VHVCLPSPPVLALGALFLTLTEHLTALSTLNLAHNQLSTAADLEGLRACPSIRILDLSNNRLDDPTAIDVRDPCDSVEMKREGKREREREREREKEEKEGRESLDLCVPLRARDTNDNSFRLPDRSPARAGARVPAAPACADIDGQPCSASRRRLPQDLDRALPRAQCAPCDCRTCRIALMQYELPSGWLVPLLSGISHCN
jgi:hypothetical protein